MAIIDSFFQNGTVNRRQVLSGMTAGAAALIAAPSLFAAENTLDLEKAEDNLTAFIKTRGSLDETETVIYWSGQIQTLIPDQRNQHLFDFEGYNIGRMIKVEGGYQLLTREMSVYKDPQSGKILSTWPNPFLERRVEVLPVWNDPVNTPILLESKYVKFPIPFSIQGELLCWPLAIFLTYPSPLPRSDYPDNSASDMYQGVELFHFYANLANALDPATITIHASVSWCRISQWLPWLEMGDRPGQLVYHCAGHKLRNGYADLPAYLREFVEANKPEFANAPSEFTEPNETSWTYFKKFAASNQNHPK